MKTIVTKAQYAALKGRKPSNVSNWIREGKITHLALVGSGVRAQIWVEQADHDLLCTLDPSQQAAQARPFAPTTTRLAPATREDGDPPTQKSRLTTG